MKAFLTTTTALAALIASMAAAQTIQPPPQAIQPPPGAPYAPGGVQQGLQQTVPLNGTTQNGYQTDNGKPTGGSTALPSTPAPFAPDLPSPGPDSTTSGPLVNRPRSEAPMQQPGAAQPQGTADEGPYPMPTFSAIPQLRQNAQKQESPAPPANTQGNTAAGTAARMGEAELDRLLRSPSGPPLPDADMGAHSGEAREEDELNRRLRLWQLRNKVGEQIITAAGNLQKYRDTTTGGGNRNPDGTPMQNGPNQQLPLQQQQQTSQSARPRTPPLPVVTKVSGLGENLSATVLVPYDSAKTFKAGDRLSNGMKIIAIKKFDVVVELRDGSRRTLPWGDSVPAYEEPEPTAARPQAQAPQRVMFPPLPNAVQPTAPYQ